MYNTAKPSNLTLRIRGFLGILGVFVAFVALGGLVFEAAGSLAAVLWYGLGASLFCLTLAGLFSARFKQYAIGALFFWGLVAAGWAYIFLTVLITGRLM